MWITAMTVETQLHQLILGERATAHVQRVIAFAVQELAITRQLAVLIATLIGNGD